MGILDLWDVSRDELNQLIEANPSLRGMLFGYVAELKLGQLLNSLPGVTYSTKFDDHDRTNKYDVFLTYLGCNFRIESKSLQTNSIRYVEATLLEKGYYVGRAQVDASDRRPVTLPDGEVVSTTCLLVGDFDLLAVNIFAFEQKWRFLFAKNCDLPRSVYRGYSEYQREHLLASLVTVTWPPLPPFYEDPRILLDQLISSRPEQSTA